MGFVSLDSVINWVDGKMQELAKPPIGLIEACCAGRSEQAVVDALRSIAGQPDEDVVAQQCYWHAGVALRSDDSLAESIASWLEMDAPGSIRVRSDNSFSFDGEFDLIAAGVSGKSRAEVVRALRQQLIDHGERPN